MILENPFGGCTSQMEQVNEDGTDKHHPCLFDSMAEALSFGFLSRDMTSLSSYCPTDIFHWAYMAL